MYITKVVYHERNEITDEDFNYFKELGIIVETDYNTVEVLGQHVQEHKENVEILEHLKQVFYTNVIEGLLDDSIDLIMIV